MRNPHAKAYFFRLCYILQMLKGGFKLQMESIRKKIGKRVAKIRSDMGMNKEQFASHIGISSQYLANLENGINCFSVEKLINFSKKVNVSTDYLLLGKTNSLYNNVKELVKDFTEEQVIIQLETIKNLVKLIKIND